ncbi:MAG: oligosaccharide flippase family protein [Terriglobia bacterium]|nr:oligosaccharide flippase family protein [Terriglobia bacterium]
MRNLLKAILKTGTGSLVSVLFGMLAIKLIAARLGVEALGSFSLVKQTITAGSAMFITGGQTALVQGMSTRTGEDRRRFLGTALVLLCGGSLLVGVVMMLSARWLAPKLLPGVQGPAGDAVSLAGVAVIVAGATAFVFGSLNGIRRIGRLAIAQSSNAVALAALVWFLLPRLGLLRPERFAAVLTVSQLPGLVIGGFFLLRERIQIWPGSFDRNSTRQFTALAFATFAAATMQGWTVLVLRGSVSARLGLRSAGLFDVAWTISMVYVMLVLGSFSTYYLPTLAAETDNRKKLIDDVLRTSLLLVVPLIAAIMAFRPMIVTLLYSREFLPATQMMRWMLLGDFFKIVSFVVAMPMIAFADTRAFLVGELGWNLAMIGATQVILRAGLGLEWLGVIFAVAYLGYLGYAWQYCRRKLNWNFPRHLILPLVFGIVVLAVVSAISWEATTVSSAGVSLAAIGSALQAWVLIRSARDSRLAACATGAEA